MSKLPARANKGAAAKLAPKPEEPNDTDTETADTVEGETSGDEAGDEEDEGEKLGYEVLEPKTIIDGVMYPNEGTEKKPVPKEKRMHVELTHSHAQQLQMGGIRLRRREDDKRARREE